MTFRQPKRIFQLALIAALIFPLGGCFSTRVKRLSEYHYKAKPRQFEMPAYTGSVQRPHVVIAVIDSSPSEEVDEKMRAKMLEQVKRRARGLGADAVQKVRLLTEKGTGYIPDQATPFPAVKQGTYKAKFMRAEAIKFPDADSQPVRK